MATIGFHASHEQISPGRLLKDVQLAEQAGFDAAMCSDHIEPWSARQGQHAQWLASYLDLGFDELYLHFVGQEQAPYIDAFAEHVLPQLRPAGLTLTGTDGAL